MSKAKAELDPAQEWQTTFDAMEDSICIIDLDSRILRCNKATERILGRPQNEIIGKFCYELVHNTDQPFENCPVVRMKSSRGRETMEFETEGRWLEVTVDPILDSEGNPTSAVHIIRDITDRKESEQTLQRSEASFRDIFDSASDMIGLQDIETMKFVYINKETERVTGQSLQEMNDRGVESFSPKDERYSIEKAAGYMQKALAGESQIFDWGLIDQDEKFHPTEVSLKRSPERTDCSPSPGISPSGRRPKMLGLRARSVSGTSSTTLCWASTEPRLMVRSSWPTRPC